MLTTAERRGAMRLAHINAGLWAIGNGLASTTLVVYLALEFGVQGLMIAAILSAPQLVGVLRLGGPWLIDRLQNRKLFCLTTYLLSTLLLLSLPILSAPGVMPSPTASLVALVALWCMYHLMEYLGTIALWSWLGDLTPRRIRGRFIGRRERWLTMGRIAGMLIAGLFVYGWQNFPDWSGWSLPDWDERKWLGYGILSVAGASMMAVSLVPLLAMPSLDVARDGPPRSSWTELLTPFADRRFIRLLYFGAWFAMSNGISQAAQGIYPIRVLKFHLFWMLSFKIAMRWGQGISAPIVGRWVDRIGNRPVMIGSQTLVAVALLFFFVSSPQQPWWLAGAWLVWISYVGLNVCLPNMMLKLSPQGNWSSYVAAYFAVGGLFYALSASAGGALFDFFDRGHGDWLLSMLGMDHFHFLFLVGFVARLLGVFWLMALIEPGAWSWRRILFGKSAV